MKALHTLLIEGWEATLQSLFPPVCLHCNAPLLGHLPAMLCTACHERIVFLGDGACRFCGAGAGAHAQLGKGCARCQSGDLQFTRATAVTQYGNESRLLVHALKFSGQRQLAGPLAAMMHERLAAAGFPTAFDAVVPVPLHPRRRRERGYNQSGLLAQEVAERLGAPFMPQALSRTRYTPAQASLTYYHRVRNPLGAFAAAADLSSASVLLVDDVLTTGTTVSECAATLRQAGAKRVYVVVFAR